MNFIICKTQCGEGKYCLILMHIKLYHIECKASIYFFQFMHNVINGVHIDKVMHKKVLYKLMMYFVLLEDI